MKKMKSNKKNDKEKMEEERWVRKENKMIKTQRERGGERKEKKTSMKQR